jgi:hypothetical protein
VEMLETTDDTIERSTVQDVSNKFTTK